jgi:hypothetical protein
MIHKHRWKKLSPNDDIGGFILCKCGQMKFLPTREMKKFNEYKKKRIKFEVK